MFIFIKGMNPKTSSPFNFPTSGSGNTTSSAMFPASGIFGSTPVSTTAPFSPYLLPSQTPWAGAALNTQPFGSVLTPNHPYLQVYTITHYTTYYSLRLLYLRVLLIFKKNCRLSYLLFLEKCAPYNNQSLGKLGTNQNVSQKFSTK